MKFTILATLVLGLSLEVMAASPSQSPEQFCADRSDTTYAKSLIKDSSNLMGFANRGGLVGGGVCWWHSRFQRNSLFLTIYKPAEKKPTKEEAEKIIGKIRGGKDIVTIPGYRNFSEFSYDQQPLIQAELEKWQKVDGIAKFSWVNGLSG
ncbi:MAG: hypothetical protein K2Q18_13515, partial [Bdellovibrionales bacterium]|nr:hypothetical protein [Bdellovibrionales bacterium]